MSGGVGAGEGNLPGCPISTLVENDGYPSDDILQDEMIGAFNEFHISSLPIQTLDLIRKYGPLDLLSSYRHLKRISFYSRGYRAKYTQAGFSIVVLLREHHRWAMPSLFVAGLWIEL